MLTDTAAVRTYFAKLGLESEIADIYLALHSYGPQNISELSRNSKVERTRIYRLIDKLMESNLIEVESHYKRGIIKAAPIANLNILISQREQEVKNLQDELGLIQQVLARNTLSDPTTHVQFYRGAEGIRQMQWNLLNAKGEILSIMHEPIQAATGDAFFKRWAERWNEGDNSCRIVLDTHFHKISDAWHAKNPGWRVKNHYTRELPTDIMAIRSDSDIYDGVVSYYNWHEGEVFGIEIHNKQIADMQRTFFDTLWSQAVPATRRRN